MISPKEKNKKKEKYIYHENKYQVRIPIGKGKQVLVGRYKTLEDAIEARDKYLTEKT